MSSFKDPLDVKEPAKLAFAKEELQIHDCIHVRVRVVFANKDIWRQLLIYQIVQYTGRGPQGTLLPHRVRWKLMRQLGNRAKHILGLDRVMHWQLRQSVEGYLGHMLYSLYHMMPFENSWSWADQLCTCAGFTFDCYLADTGWFVLPKTAWKLPDEAKDRQLQEFTGMFLGPLQMSFLKCTCLECM